MVQMIGEWFEFEVLLQIQFCKKKKKKPLPLLQFSLDLLTFVITWTMDYVLKQPKMEV